MNVPRIFLALAMIAASLATPTAFAKAMAVPSVSTTNDAPLPSSSSRNPDDFLKSLEAFNLIPGERPSICQKFLEAIRNNDKVAAREFVSPSAQKKLDADFTKMHQILKNAPPLEEKFADKTPAESIGPLDNVWTLGYSIRDGDKWKNAKLTLFNLKGEKPEIDRWVISTNDFPLQNEQMKQDAKFGLVLQFIGLNLLIALCGGIILAVFLGFRSRRKLA